MKRHSFGDVSSDRFVLVWGSITSQSNISPYPSRDLNISPSPSRDLKELSEVKVRSADTGPEKHVMCYLKTDVEKK